MPRMNLPDPPPPAGSPKSAFRAWVRGQLKAAPDAPSQDVGRVISNHVWDLLAGRSAGILVGYVPIRGELETMYALQRALKQEWTVGVPRCHAKESTPTIETLPAETLRDGPDGVAWDTSTLEPDAWGMLAPRVRVPIRPGSVAAILVPGLAFDLSGYRLGRGAGVYDRLLASLPEDVLRIGLIQTNRVVPALPREPHDVPMHVLVTPEAILHPA